MHYQVNASVGDIIRTLQEDIPTLSMSIFLHKSDGAIYRSLNRQSGTLAISTDLLSTSPKPFSSIKIASERISISASNAHL